MNFPGIYAITNLVTGTSYIGQTRNMRIRWVGHRSDLRTGSHRNTYLLNAWRKYGEEAFSFTVICDLRWVPEADLQNTLNEAEIEELASRGKTYNLMEAGISGTVASEETKALLSVQRLAMWQDPEFRSKRIEALRALHNNPEFNARRLEGVREARQRPEARAQTSEIAKARWADPEFRAKMSAKKIANWADPAYRAKQSQGRSASWANPEIRERRMAGLLKAAANPEVIAARTAGLQPKRAQISEAHYKLWQDPAYRAKQAASRAAARARKKAAAAG